MATLFQRFTSSTVIAALTAAVTVIPAAPARASGNEQKYEITCQSNGYGEQFCSAPNRKVKLVDDFSGRCDKNDTWRYDDRGIYVRGGCAARFRVTTDGYADSGYGYPDGNGEYRKKDNTGTIIGAVAIGAGLLWLISQGGKNKKKSEEPQTGNDGGNWVDPDGRQQRSGGLRLSDLSTYERRAFDLCDTRVRDDVRARGGRNLALRKIVTIAPGGEIDRTYVTSRYGADFEDKSVTRTVECQITGNRVTQYKLS